MSCVFCAAQRIPLFSLEEWRYEDFACYSCWCYLLLPGEVCGTDSGEGEWGRDYVSDGDSAWSAVGSRGLPLFVRSKQEFLTSKGWEL